MSDINLGAYELKEASRLLYSKWRVTVYSGSNVYDPWNKFDNYCKYMLEMGYSPGLRIYRKVPSKGWVPKNILICKEPYYATDRRKGKFEKFKGRKPKRKRAKHKRAKRKDPTFEKDVITALTEPGIIRSSNLKSINIDVVKKYKDVFNWWLNTGKKCWMRNVAINDVWVLGTPDFIIDKLYVMDDEYAEFRRAALDGENIYEKVAGCWSIIDSKSHIYSGNASSYKIQSKRWRSDTNKAYWYVTDNFTVRHKFERRRKEDNDKYNCGNYFKSSDGANNAINAIKKESDRQNT